jgi:acetyl-CoA/propionyl-CoA carboxylase carboxyl transferase subunit
MFPDSPRRAYDVLPVVRTLLDDGAPTVELHPRWAPNITTTLGRLGGGTVGVLANNPLRLGGCLDAASAEKAARFVRTCDAFGIPLVVLVDVPGYLPGVSQEWDGVVRRGAKLLHAFAEATVPRVTVITRKAYGGAYIAMNSRALGATRVLAWPDAQVAVMGATAAVRILHRRDLAAADDHERPALEARLAAAHEQASSGVAKAVELELVDDVIEPDVTRSAISAALAGRVVARGRHTNIPL